MTWIRRVETLLAAGAVQRMHTVRTLQRYPVASHVYGAQVIAAELCAQNFVPSGPVLLHLLYHDAPEVRLGDMPAPFKRGLGAEAKADLEEMELRFFARINLDLPPLDALQMDIARCSDYLDLAYFCLLERELGNGTPMIERVFERALSYTDGHFMRGLDRLVSELRLAWAKGRKCLEEV